MRYMQLGKERSSILRIQKLYKIHIIKIVAKMSKMRKPSSPTCHVLWWILLAVVQPSYNSQRILKIDWLVGSDRNSFADWTCAIDSWRCSLEKNLNHWNQLRMRNQEAWMHVDGGKSWLNTLKVKLRTMENSNLMIF